MITETDALIMLNLHKYNLNEKEINESFRRESRKYHPDIQNEYTKEQKNLMFDHLVKSKEYLLERVSKNTSDLMNRVRDRRNREPVYEEPAQPISRNNLTSFTLPVNKKDQFKGREVSTPLNKGTESAEKVARQFRAARRKKFQEMKERDAHLTKTQQLIKHAPVGICDYDDICGGSQGAYISEQGTMIPASLLEPSIMDMPLREYTLVEGEEEDEAPWQEINLSQHTSGRRERIWSKEEVDEHKRAKLQAAMAHMQRMRQIDAKLLK